MYFAHNHLRVFISERENPDDSFYLYFFYYSSNVLIWEFVLGCLTAQSFFDAGRRRDATRTILRSFRYVHSIFFLRPFA